MPGPIDSVYVDGSPVAKSDVRGFGKTREVLVMADATEVSNADLALQLILLLKSNGRIYRLNTGDTTTAPDGETFLRDINGLGFELVEIEGLDGRDGATIIVQDTPPATSYESGSLWIDADSAQIDLYTLTGLPLAWTDTGVNLKGPAGTNGTNGTNGASSLTVVRVVATTDVSIASALEAGDALDGVTLVAGDFILLTAQTAPAENGVYEVPASGAASRAAAFSTYDSMPGCYFSVMEGTAGADKLYRCTSNRGGTLETDAIAISEFTSGGGSSGREVLSANRTYYVAPSGSGGSDSNDGLTALTPFLTKQKAWNTILTLDLNGFVATIQVADGTYTAGISSAFAPVGGTVVIQGNSGTPANVLISTTSGHCFNFTGLPKNVTIKDLKVQTTTSGVGIRAADKGVTVSFSNINFGACATQHVNVSSGASISATGAYAISGGAPNHVRADGAGSAFAASTITVTLTGTPSFSHAFVWGFSASVQNWFNITFSGAATGARYQVESNAVINSFGGGTSYFPGNAAGVGTNSGASPYGLYQ